MKLCIRALYTTTPEQERGVEEDVVVVQAAGVARVGEARKPTAALLLPCDQTSETPKCHSLCFGSWKKSSADCFMEWEGPRAEIEANPTGQCCRCRVLGSSWLLCLSRRSIIWLGCFVASLLARRVSRV